MDLKIPYMFYTSAIEPKVCNRIIEFGKTKVKPAFINHLSLSKETDNDIRNSRVSWLTDEWIYELIDPYIKNTNEQAGWYWKFNHIEPIQFTKYGLNEHYDWHTDSGSDHFAVYKNEVGRGLNGNVRKISVTVNLVDGSEYEGGNLEFDFGPKGGKDRIKVCDEIKPKGSIIVFPSFIPHRVTPVTKGIRYSLVMWVIGKPWQ